MCGIAGFIKYSNNSDSLIREMCDLMHHRGPDDEGYYSDEKLCLGMRRLSIIDIQGGHQPIYNEDKSIVVFLNGEIYNYLELRERYCKGHTFSTNSDTEVLVHLYEVFKEDMWNYLNGMFSIALYDIKKSKLFIVRDRLGIKPLYYTLHRGALIFASEIKPLLAHNVSKEINTHALFDYLSLSYVPSPYSMFKSVNKVEAGTYIACDCKNGSTSTVVYWEPHVTSNSKMSEQDAIDQLDYLFKDSIKLQLQSDVPVGTFLSGGLDSSAVVACEALVSNYQINTFSVGFSNNNYSELPYAKFVAEKYHTKHTEFVIEPEELIQNLPRLVSIMEEPCGDSAFLPTMILSKYASQSVKVILNGTGGDELFGGYKRYNSKQYGHPSLRLLSLLPQAVINQIPRSSKRLIRAKKILQYLRNEEYYFVNCSLVYDDDETDSMFKVGRGSIGLEERIAAELRLQKKINPSLDYPSLFMLMDIKTYLKDDLLLLLDKILMASSIEGRVPFLDHRIVEFALSLPISLKIQKNDNKYILKKWLENKLGSEFVQRPKIGFGTPIHNWYDSSFKKYAREILSDPKVKARGYINPDSVELLIDKNQYLIPQKIFNLVCLELWFREYLDK